MQGFPRRRCPAENSKFPILPGTPGAAGPYGTAYAKLEVCVSNWKNIYLRAV